MVGGKLASYRIFAEEMTDILASRFGLAVRSSTHEKPLPGGDVLVDAGTLAQRMDIDTIVGVTAHEMGHAYDLPDLYDLNEDSDLRGGGVGDWSLMGGGAWNDGGTRPPLPDAWSRFQLGWTDVIEVGACALDAVLIPATRGGAVYAVTDQGDPAANEVILVENRVREGWGRKGRPGECRVDRVIHRRAARAREAANAFCARADAIAPPARAKDAHGADSVVFRSSRFVEDGLRHRSGRSARQQ